MKSRSAIRAGRVLETAILSLLVIGLVVIAVSVRGASPTAGETLASLSQTLTPKSAYPAPSIVSSTSPTPQPSATQIGASTPTPSIDPAYPGVPSTPLPLITLSPLPSTPPAPTHAPRTPLPTKSADDPYTVVMMAAPRKPRTEFSTKESTIIVEGHVTKLLPPRWTTSDGKGPDNPQTADFTSLIYTPVEIQVDRYLKGELRLEQVIVFAQGGKIGADWVQWEGDDLFTFHGGDDVVLFLAANPQLPRLGSTSLLEIREHYTIKDGQAVNSIRKVPLQQLLQEIDTALGRPRAD